MKDRTMRIKSHFIRTSCLFSFIFISIAIAAYATQADGNAQTFTGEITDSLCAKAGSHDQMMQDMKSMGRDKASCTIKCIQLGAKYVLFDASKGVVYTLDDQEKAGRLAGHKVRVSGTLKKQSIKVMNIEAAE
jgi:Protein of unknown function (DUF5818)